MSEQGKVALVTGAARGIGKAVAQALLAAGYRVVFAGRTAEPLEALAAQARAEGHTALAVQCDVSDPDSVERLFAQVREHFGRLDVLFNNAGINAPAVSIDELSVAQWKAVLDTNLTGVFLCSRAAFALMKSQSARRPHHQQRLDLGALAASQHGAVHGHQARHYRADQEPLAGWPRL